MGVSGTGGMVLREARAASTQAAACPRCGRTNRTRASRCAWCHAALPGKPAVRVVSPVPPRAELDDLFGELESLTLDDARPVQYQCPACGRLVDADASRCPCGAIFEDPDDIVGYECPLCGNRVGVDATRCGCGARFAD